ncbi:glycosyltransferase family 2 protein [Maricaulis sp.]|uniref:glycosyltransferase family 2 protein n=1 Tax=Maricaulis sp. TaxID=1486257 RepID=UPI002B2673C0|nr:glycosyltransferase [Maricaulis sp.]
MALIDHDIREHADGHEPRQRTSRPRGGHAFRPTRLARPPAHLAALWAQQAAFGLPGRQADLSAFGPTSVRMGHGFLAVLAALLLLTIAMPASALATASVITCALFSGLIALRLAAAVLKPAWLDAPPCADDELPSATIMVALYREAAILPDLARGLAVIDYPADRIAFKLVLEADDSETIHVARSLALDDRFEIIVVPPGEPRTKPRALNYALRLCRSELVTIHDAEDRPDPRQLRRAAEAFRVAGQRLACIQAPLNWYNRRETWLTRQFALEYAAHFHALLPLYQRLGWPLPLGGTSNHFRRDALVRAGGWDAWNVTEDADLGLRLHAAGYRCGLIEPATLEEAPLRLVPWIKQRTRWIKGYAQTIGVLAVRRDTPWRRVWPGVLVLGGAVASALLHAPLSLACLIALAAGAGSGVAAGAGGQVAMVFMAAGYASAIACAAVAMRRARLPVRARDLAGMPVYWLLQTLAAARALRQLIIDPHHWEKTEHGLSALTETPCISPSSPRSSPLPDSLRSSLSPAGDPDSRSAPNADPASSPGS